MRWWTVIWLPLFACTSGAPEDTDGFRRDAGVRPIVDAGHATKDAGAPDAGHVDAGTTTRDGGVSTRDGGTVVPFTGCPGAGAPFDVFNAFWTAFDTNYAVFDYRLPNGDWNTIGRDGCASIDVNTGEDALFDVLIGMAQNLDDGHVQLGSPGGREEDAWVSAYPYYDEAQELEFNAESNYIEEDELTWAAEDWFAWGTIGDVGYISITSFDELSSTGDEDDDREAAVDAIEEALDDLSGVRAMIVDVRANEGGWDTVALDVAQHFAGPRSLAWSKQRRNGPGHLDFGAPEDWYVEASDGDAFDGPVVVLTSRGTFSAAETFTLAMRVRTNVEVVGERGSGHFSDLVEQTMPAGWSLELSGERYRAADGEIYETTGVPVDLAVAFDRAALVNGTDTMLEAALMRLAP